MSERDGESVYLRRIAGTGSGAKETRDTGADIHGIAVLDEGHAVNQPASDAHSELPRIPRRQSLRRAALDVFPAVEDRRRRGALVRRALATADVVTFGTATGTLLAIAFVAALLPSIRASRVDPALVLRGE